MVQFARWKVGVPVHVLQGGWSSNTQLTWIMNDWLLMVHHLSSCSCLRWFLNWHTYVFFFLSCFTTERLCGLLLLRCAWETPGLGSFAGKGPGWGVQRACQPAGIGKSGKYPWRLPTTHLFVNTLSGLICCDMAGRRKPNWLESCDCALLKPTGVVQQRVLLPFALFLLKKQQQSSTCVFCLCWKWKRTLNSCVYAVFLLAKCVRHT